jgi:hypothetical protein
MDHRKVEEEGWSTVILSNKARTSISWTLTGLVVLFLAFDAISKIAKVPQVLEACTKLGFAESAVPIIGFVLLVGIILLLIPKTNLIGAIYITGFLGGAVAINLRSSAPLFSNVLFPVYFGCIMWLGIIIRNPEIGDVLMGKTSHRKMLSK